jgi:type II secretion system protein N
MRQRIVSIAGGASLFVFVFVLGLLLTFPMGIVTRVAEAQTEKALGFKYDVHIGGTSLSGLNGVKATDVDIAPVEAATAEGPRLPLHIERVRVSAGLLALLRGKLSATVEAEFRSGSLVARYLPGETNPHRIELDVFDVDLRDIDLIRQRIGMPLSGVVRGNVNLEYNAEARLGGGDVNLSVSPLVLGPGSVKAPALRILEGGVPLPATQFGTVAIRAAISESDLTIESFESDGSDVQLSASGRVQLRDPMKASVASLDLRFHIDDAYKDKAGLGAVFGTVPWLQRASCGEGWYGIKVAGPIGRLGPPAPLGAACRQGRGAEAAPAAGAGAANRPQRPTRTPRAEKKEEVGAPGAAKLQPPSTIEEPAPVLKPEEK